MSVAETASKRQLALNLFVYPGGHHEAAWRYKGSEPEQITDRIELWFQNGAADGFNIMPPYLTGGFDIFAEEVVPILRKRGLFREDYDSQTLRGHYGLPRPESLYSQPQQMRETV